MIWVDLTFLDDHSIIGWDLDGTLVNGIYSDAFCNYIEMHPHKRHYFITFRDQEWAEFARVELDGLVSPSNIAGIHAIPQDIFLSLERAAMTNPDAENVTAVTHWKGRTAAALGCTVVVDDMVATVRPGCRANNILFVDANRPFGFC